jgi:hypothetical protein
MAKRRNQRKLARFLFGIGGVFFAVCAYQWLQEGAFRSRFGGNITKAGDPAQFWTTWSVAVAGSALLTWTCLTWNRRNAAKQFPDDEK